MENNQKYVASSSSISSNSSRTPTPNRSKSSVHHNKTKHKTNKIQSSEGSSYQKAYILLYFIALVAIMSIVISLVFPGMAEPIMLFLFYFIFIAFLFLVAFLMI